MVLLVPFNSIGLIIFSFAALKIDYSQVIDTAYIFKYANLPTTASPSLNSLCKVLA
jgi:hypothetical protein